MQSPSRCLRRAIGVNFEGLASASPFCFKSKQVKLYIISSLTLSHFGTGQGEGEKPHASL